MAFYLKGKNEEFYYDDIIKCSYVILKPNSSNVV